jgi:hypothetical protein
VPEKNLSTLIRALPAAAGKGPGVRGSTRDRG